MFRTKKDVDRHVQNIFSKLRNENEKNLRCYNVAKLYYQVGDYESAKRYVSSYLEVRDGSASAHKLLGHVYEALGQKEAAFNEYKTSLELEGRQDDLILKVCELLGDMDIGMDANKLKYWVERADKQFPHHPVVFQLKEKLLTVERPNNNSEDLEALIASELTARPNDVLLRVKLLKHYMSKHKYNNAYEHAASVEATHSHRNSIVWYQTLCELLTKCKETKHSDWSFWVLYISALERFAALCLKEQCNEMRKSVPEATQAVFNLDQNLNELKLKNFSKHHVFTEHILTHMYGQLYFHLACLLLRKTKREQGSWSETGRLCAPLLLIALHVTPIDPNATWTMHIKDQSKSQINLWHIEGSYRCSQAGHVLQDYAIDDVKKLMDKIDKFCTGKWRERVYQRIFVSRLHLDCIRNSYFCNYSSSNPPLRLCSQNELKRYDEVAERMWPDSLHHQIWLGIQLRSHGSHNKDSGPQPHQYSHVFPELQFSVYNMNQAAPDSLSQLDIDAFLNAAILCSFAIVEEQQLGSFLSPDRLPTLPADLTPTLCTCTQDKWWSAAYKMYSKQKDIDSDIGELRQELQQGLEVVRCIGNHGLHPVLLVHLARIFQHRAKMLKEKDKEHSDVLTLEARAELYWTTAVPLLERLQNNQTIRMSVSKLFNYQGKELNNIELTNAIEEGKLLLAQRFVRDKQYEQAIDALQVLKCPDASFQQAQIYKMFADEIVNSMPRESLTSEMRSQHIIMLSKARNCLYLTLDRLRSPGMNPKHPLNSELGTHISDIENELKRIDPDLGRGDISRNDCDGMSDESYSPAHSAVDQTVNNTTLPTLTPLIVPHNILSTPQRNTQRTPKQTSTPCRPQHHDVLDLSRNRTEARPSPERLDAQIRQIMHSRDNEIQELVEQMKSVKDNVKLLTEKMDSLMKEVMESRKENQKQYQQQQQRVQQQQQHQQINVNANVEDDFYVLGDDEYADLNYSNQAGQAASAIASNIFTPPHRHPYPSLMYPSATALLQNYYQGGIPGINDPNAQAIPSLYPHNNVYPMPVLYPNRSKIPDNLLQQSLFASRLPPQLSDLMTIPATNPPSVQIPLQKVEPLAKPDTTSTVIKDAPVNKVLPVNVVITSSDTLPTTIPLIQPTLSVTIPPQYRLGGATSISNASLPITTMTVTTESSNVPHCYQISMPSQATIPTTINLPSLQPTLTTTPASMQTMQTADAHRIRSTDHKEAIIASAIYESIESPNNSAEICETEHDPIPDFIPVIPLPAEVKVTTGEEDEVTLYCGRAKLFRFVDKEWKERGVGDVKLLRNIEGKVRLLMRRDQVLKICANHLLRPDMELTAMANNKRAWCWVANDFADEQLKLEKLSIKFKTAEEALAFKEAFDKAKLNLTGLEKAPKTTDDKISSSCSEKDTFKTQKLQSNQQNKISSIAEAIPTDKPIKTGTTTLGGFSFSSKPIVQEISDADATNEPKKSEESSKVSPFSKFTFTKSITTTITSTPSTGFIFATTVTPVTTSQSDKTTVSHTTPIFTTQASTFDQNSPTLHTLRRPRASPPGLTKAGLSSEKEARSQTENEQKLFDGKANLQCQNSDTNQWDNKGAGSIKLLLDVKSGKLRLLMMNDESSKILYGHGIPLNMAFTLKSGATVVNWTVPPKWNSGKTLSIHAATFETPESASQFYNAVSSCQQKLSEGCFPSNVIKEFEKETSHESNDRNAMDNKSQPSLMERFKPPVGSWSCSGCYVINTSTTLYCISCNTPKDPSQPPKPQTNAFQMNLPSVISTTTTTPITTFTFGIPKDTAEETTGTTGFTFRMSKTEDKSESAKTIAATSKPVMKTEETFVFGMPIKTSTSVNSSDSPFIFSTPTKSSGFNFTAHSPIKSPGGENSGEDEVIESDDIHFSPVIPLPDKIEVKTGEEDEEVLYSHRAKLFRFDTNNKEWKERGLGDIKLLRHKENGKLRLIMRRDQILKLCLNHLITPELEFTPKDEKTWLWNAADYSEGEIEYMQFACRFKTSEIAENFKKAINNAIIGIKSNIINSEKVNKSSTKVQSTTMNLSPQEIEILYEVKVTPEEKAAALKLQLPENFYAYKWKKDCTGCRGCGKPNIVLYPDVTSAQSIKWSTGSEVKNAISSELINVVSSKLGIPNVTFSENDIKNTEVQSQETQSVIKNGFSFSMAPTTTFKTPPIASTFTSGSAFDGSVMSFGTGDLKLFNDKKSTTFSFGMNPQFGVNEATETAATPDKQNTSLLENIKICSPSNAQTTQAVTSNVTGGQSIFGQATSASIFKTPTFNFDASKNIFGGSSATLKTSIFGGNTSLFPNTFDTMKTIATTATTTTNSTSKISVARGIFDTNTPLFGSAVTQPVSKPDDTVTTTTSTITFDISNQSNNSIFNTTPFSKITFGNNNSQFNNPVTTTTNIFGTKPSDNIQNNDDTTVGSGFFSNNITFSALAAKVAQPEAFKKDPNFSFAGAGSSVFGSNTSTSSPNTSVKTERKSQHDSMQKDDNEDDSGEVDNEQEHDPHFEPIIPLPDTVEVRTGEEDEDKVFSQRAKLYRYNNVTKEWKERGVGEMKILHHTGYGSYRLLLRREQVHKVVCNFLLTSDVEFHPLSTSQQAWMWAGMNHAEEEPCVEQLAVKFKSSNLAAQFIGFINKIQQELREKESAQDERGIGELEYGRDNEVYEEEEEDNGDVEDEEEVDDEDDQGLIAIIEKHATVYAKWPKEMAIQEETDWELVGSGNLAIYYDSDIFAERILLKLDDSEEYVSNTIISVGTEMQVEGTECIWSAIDYALSPALKRVLKAVFSSEQAAQEMYKFFEEGLISAKQAGVVEYQE